MPTSTGRESAFLNPKLLSAIVLGGLLGGLTLAIPKLGSLAENAVVAAVQRGLVALLLPGLIGAAGVSGNVHAWPLWIAAGINMVIYFVAGWLTCWAVMGLLRRRT